MYLNLATNKSVTDLLMIEVQHFMYLNSDVSKNACHSSSIEVQHFMYLNFNACFMLNVFFH